MRRPKRLPLEQVIPTMTREQLEEFLTRIIEADRRLRDHLAKRPGVAIALVAESLDGPFRAEVAATYYTDVQRIEGACAGRSLLDALVDLSALLGDR